LVATPPMTASGKLTVTAWTENGIIMGMSHRTCPLCGIQFHPESFMTQYGFSLVENFLALGPLVGHLPNTQSTVRPAAGSLPLDQNTGTRSVFQ
jgi:hypothetical protein